MARVNEILVGRFNRMLQKLLSMKGPASMYQLSPELQAVLAFRSGVENRYLESWYRFWNIVGIGPSVGNNNGLQLRNPLTSNVIAVIEQFRYEAAAGDTITLSLTRNGATTTDLTNLLAVNPQDFRQVQGATGSGSALILSSFSPVVSFSTTPQAYTAAAAATDYDTIFTENQEWVINPGDTVRIINATANVLIRFNLKWRERFLEDSERA